MGIEKFDREGRFLRVDYEDFILMNIYFPNGKASQERLDYKMDFYDSFFEYANDLKAEGKKLVICGDVNTAHKEIDLARPKQNETASGFLPEERPGWTGSLLPDISIPSACSIAKLETIPGGQSEQVLVTEMSAGGWTTFSSVKTFEKM